MTIAIQRGLALEQDGIMGRRSVDIIIVNYNTQGLLKLCLENLLEIGFSVAQITVVDNASLDGSREWLQSKDCPKVGVLFPTKNLGFAGGNNLAIKTTYRPYVLLLNTDAFPLAGSIEKLGEVIGSEPNIAVVGPQLLYPDGRWQRSAGRLASPRTAILDLCGWTSLEQLVYKINWAVNCCWAQLVKVEYVDGACMLIRRSVLDSIGLLDESMFFYCEDMEFCARAQDKGLWVCYIPKSTVIHLRGASSFKKDRIGSLQMKKKSMQEFVTKYYGTAAWSHFCVWTKRNYRWRYAACKIATLCGIDLRERCAEYRDLIRIYQKEIDSSKAKRAD